MTLSRRTLHSTHCSDRLKVTGFFFFQAEDGIRDSSVTGVQTCALPILGQPFICTCRDDPVVVGTSLITFASQQVVATATQSATSATSLAISTGSKTFTTQAGKAFQVGQWMLIQETSNSANQMLGQITAYVGTSLTVNVIATGGSGTHADWTIVLTNSPAAAGYQPPVGSGNVTRPGSSVPGHVANLAGGTGQRLQE